MAKTQQYNRIDSPIRNSGMKKCLFGLILLWPTLGIADNFWQCVIDERKEIVNTRAGQIVVNLCRERYPPSYEIEDCPEPKKKGRYSELISSVLDQAAKSGTYLEIDKPPAPKEVCPKKTLILPEPVSPWPWEPQTKSECSFEYSKGLTSNAAFVLVSRACGVLYRKR